MILPPTFKKVQGTISSADNKNKEAKKGGGKEGNKKLKNKNRNGNLVKNHGQPDKFKVAKGETLKDTLVTLLPKTNLHGMRK